MTHHENGGNVGYQIDGPVRLLAGPICPQLSRSLTALTAKPPPSFSITALLRRAVELDHDAHTKDTGPISARKRRAEAASGLARLGCLEGATTPLASKASKKSKKRRKAPAPVVSELGRPTPSAPAGEGRKKTKKNKARRGAKKKADRDEAFVEHGHQARPSAHKAYVSSAEQVATEVELGLNNLPATSCGYQAKAKNSSKPAVLSLRR
ncbi:hypothetical protein BKA70DRAFT_1401245 [Coprinopsis sp. MPI-PUGE-AT-0042]|nr:hypothetical protein BKA70DRAFT_1401245 [Coprinopsis sp. MPI-PUGE-AT-0042]